MRVKSFFSDFFCSDQNDRLATLSIVLSATKTSLLKKQAEILELTQKIVALESSYNSCVNNLDKTKADMQANITILTRKCTRLQLILSDTNLQIQKLMEERDIGLSLLSHTTKEILKEYDTRYAAAEISYSGRYLGNKTKRYSLDVKAFCSQGMNDRKIVQRVDQGKCYVKEIIRELKVDFHTACDIAVMRVSNVFKCNYSYDSSTWQTPEFWMFASETEAFGMGDCEDMAIWRYVGCRIAGIPPEMLRVAAGTTFSNEGHATNFYFASDLRWHHINSTSNFSAAKDVCDLPVTKQSSDRLNLRDVWFSFNEKKTWHDLVTSSQKKAVNKKRAQNLLKYFKITPIMGLR